VTALLFFCYEKIVPLLLKILKYVDKQNESSGIFSILKEASSRKDGQAQLNFGCNKKCTCKLLA
jgi:hypothetical protein